MATIKESPFTQYEFSAIELLNAQIFNPLQRQYLQTLRGEYAAQKLSLAFDPQNPIAFAQQEAELSGQLSILSLLLDGHISAEAELKSIAFETQNQSQN